MTAPCRFEAARQPEQYGRTAANANSPDFAAEIAQLQRRRLFLNRICRKLAALPHPFGSLADRKHFQTGAVFALPMAREFGPALPICRTGRRRSARGGGHDSLAATRHNSVERFVATCVANEDCRGKPDGDVPLPTTLPHRRRADVKPSPARVVLSFLFNGAMLVSALILAFIVLVREEQYALGQQPSQAGVIQQADTTGESQAIPPLN
jgi:hypothetical protein